jgi:hypothetical protein
MSNIDRQRVAAVRKLEGMGYTFAAGDWMQPANDTAAPAITDDLYALLVKRADALMGCTEGSAEERKLEAIAYAVEAYEAVRWPNGKADCGEG